MTIATAIVVAAIAFFFQPNVNFSTKDIPRLDLRTSPTVCPHNGVCVRVLPTIVLCNRPGSSQLGDWGSSIRLSSTLAPSLLW